MPASPVIEVRGLTKHYGDVVGVRGIDLVVERGEVFGFLGPNGAGKTTTIRLLLDLIRPSSGEARLFGRKIGAPELRSRVGYLPGELVLDERMTGTGNLDFFSRLSTPAGLPAAVRRAEFCERLSLRPEDLLRPVRDYSRGMKQKLGLVAALQHDPDLLILDEPTTGLDPLVREALFEIMIETGRAGKTLFHSSHVLSEVDRTCTRVGIIREGRLLAVREIDAMRRTVVRRMVVRFAGAAPIAELKLPGIELVEHDGSQVVLRVAGPLDPLIRALARHEVVQLVFPEANLEEAFVELYRKRQGEPS